jgi:hypothetical protein
MIRAMDDEVCLVVRFVTRHVAEDAPLRLWIIG